MAAFFLSSIQHLVSRIWYTYAKACASAKATATRGRCTKGEWNQYLLPFLIEAYLS